MFSPLNNTYMNKTNINMQARNFRIELNNLVQKKDKEKREGRNKS